VEMRSGTIRPEPWRWKRPRVLIEHPDEAAGLAIASKLRLDGYAVAVCCGPHEPGECPLTGPDGCPTAEDADLVVSCLGFEREAAREVVQALRMRCPQVPLAVLAVPATPDEVAVAAREMLAPTARPDAADA
jgi:hypothetical protein